MDPLAIGEDVTRQDPPVGKPQRDGCLHIWLHRDADGLRPGDAGELRRQRDGDGKHGVLEAWAKGRRQSDRKYQRGK